eukprot:1060600-Amphidinium_carterae.1
MLVQILIQAVWDNQIINIYQLLNSKGRGSAAWEPWVPQDGSNRWATVFFYLKAQQAACSEAALLHGLECVLNTPHKSSVVSGCHAFPGMLLSPVSVVCYVSEWCPHAVKYVSPLAVTRLYRARSIPSTTKGWRASRSSSTLCLKPVLISSLSESLQQSPGSAIRGLHGVPSSAKR